ncbi:alpha/beta fold hydrolase [Actinoplanes sp. NPDC051346]|uniref:thioesterase II family protein n=1 Tax=Actinoplanes sp. NPDC051346 TaxID=3155048 RepID=UPI00344770CE
MSTSTTTGRLPGDRWLARPRPVPDPALRVIAIPHVGGGGAAFNVWRDQLPPGVELCAVRLPGRENRLSEPPVEDLETLLELLEPALRPVLDRPFVLVGHSSGSVIAFELARRLRARGAPQPAMLVVSAADAPRRRKVADLHLLPQEALLRRVADFGGMAPAVLDDADLMAVFERIIRADYRITELARYVPEPPLDVPVTVIGGRHDPFVDRGAMADWAQETTRDFTLHLIDAGHFLLPDAGPLLADLTRRLLERS